MYCRYLDDPLSHYKNTKQLEESFRTVISEGRNLSFGENGGNPQYNQFIPKLADSKHTIYLQSWRNLFLRLFYFQPLTI